MAAALKTSQSVPQIIWPFLLLATSIWTCFGLSHFATMCGIALSIYATIKLHTLMAYRNRSRAAQFERPGTSDVVAWFLLWPGLDARAFFRASSRDTSVPIAELAVAFAKIAFGATMFFLVAPWFLKVSRLGAGWIALLGVVFMLHFGSFHLLALWWQSRGRAVRPIMNAPILATSVSEFWGKRWNLAFRDYASAFLFRPLARKWSPVTALLCGYVFSGIVHEMAISVPAGGGYGLPTLYFALQGLAMLAERRLGLNGGAAGWFWTFSITAPTAFFLFHPPFVNRVVVPLIEVLPASGV